MHRNLNPDNPWRLILKSESSIEVRGGMTVLISRFARASRYLVLAASWLLLLSVTCSAATFSADMIQKGVGRVIKGKLYVKGTKVRQEITAGGQKQATIVRPDKKLVWLLYPGKRSYMLVTRRVISGIDDPAAQARIKQMSTTKKLGKETVNRYLCTKTQYTTRSKYKYVLTEWYADKLKYVIKMEVKGVGQNDVIEYKNIKEGNVPDSMFEVPKGYRKIPTPTGPPVERR
jgi:hypothetical protein